MENSTRYDNFPLRIVFLCSSVTLAIYVLGMLILLGFGLAIAFLYVMFCLYCEYRVMKYSCVHCAYYGKLCGFGRGKLASLLFGPGDPQRFIDRKVTWVAVLPDFLVFLIPLVGGLILLIKDFDGLLLLAMVLLVILAFGAPPVTRGQYACKYCKQKDIFCPAEQLFRKAGQ
jgi:hypothetical protein